MQSKTISVKFDVKNFDWKEFCAVASASRESVDTTLIEVLPRKISICSTYTLALELVK